MLWGVAFTQCKTIVQKSLKGFLKYRLFPIIFSIALLVIDISPNDLCSKESILTPAYIYIYCNFKTYNYYIYTCSLWDCLPQHLKSTWYHWRVHNVAAYKSNWEIIEMYGHPLHLSYKSILLNYRIILYYKINSSITIF